jgi:hypothetical protein
MGIQVNINSITGQSPFNIFICDSNGDNCIYIDKINEIPNQFEIPSPYNTQTEYKIKIIDGNGSTITGNAIVQG